ncbi:VWA domain-containing protein [Terrilactibacillus laevilacticus]|uniref:VWA domain-containing protein n=1 Tax=Terrilactibacillus laevilacticus TaxID=1380157 RepID=A0ABW5PRN0_9BACI|nr:VWA domain-containing protein [Terrilactibacillus laevilacticus]
MRKLLKVILLVTSVIILTSCNSEKDKEQSTSKTDITEETDKGKSLQEETETEKETETEDVKETGIIQHQKEMPQTIEGIVKYPVGDLAGKDTSITDKKVQTTLESIPTYPKNAGEDDINQLLYYLYSLYKMEYEDPKIVVDMLSIGKSPGDLPNKMKTDTFNVEIILDSSGSMANKIGTKTRMDLAKEAIKEFAKSLPKESNIALRVYGHKGTGSEADKKMSCQSSELVYDVQPYEEKKLNDSLNKIAPAGWTPLAQSLKEAKKDLRKYTGEKNQNIIYLVSDGIETCGGDPVKAAKGIKSSTLSPVVNIIGYDVDQKGQSQLKEVAQAAGGKYVNVKNQEQLTSEFNQTTGNSMKWLAWKSNQNIHLLQKTVSQQIHIYQLTSRWTTRNYKEQNLIQRSLQSLLKDDKITYDQYTKLTKKVSSYYQKQIKQVTNLQEKLLNNTDKNLDNSLKEVEDIYSKNIQ